MKNVNPIATILSPAFLQWCQICEQCSGDLEGILGHRLHRVDRRLLNSAHRVEAKGVYDETYWQTEQERQVALAVWCR